jgi:hypothetical protein
MKRVYVTVDRRRFLVDLDDDGQPRRVKERKLYGKPPIEGWFDQTAWSLGHHRMPKKGIIFRAMDEAQKRRSPP